MHSHLTNLFVRPSINAVGEQPPHERINTMKPFPMKQLCLAMLCLVAMLGFSGCTSDDDPPADISGTWTCTFTRGTETHADKPWTFVQSGQNVTGSYVFDVATWPFTGTYVDGVFNGIDTDDWTLQLEFEEDSATGTISGDGEVWTANLSR